MGIRFANLIKAIDKLSSEEVRELQAYLQQREQQIELCAGTLNMDILMFSQSGELLQNHGFHNGF